MQPSRSACAVFVLAILSSLPTYGQASMCGPVTNNPLVMANLCSSAPGAESLPTVKRVIPAKPPESALTLTVEQVNQMVLDTAPLIHPGDFMLFETNRRDFVLHLLLSNGKEIVTQPLTRADADDTSIAWRVGRIRLDYPEALNQRIVRQKLVPLHSGGTPLLIRGIKIDGKGKLIFELEKTPPGQARPIPVEPPMSYPPDPHVMTASASRPDIWGHRPETGFLAPKLPPFSVHPMMFQSTTSTGDPNHFKWNGKELDSETGLYNFGARYYSPALGRFVTPDPKIISKQRMRDPQQWNMYSYSRNNPTSMFDPNGLEVRMLEQGANRDQMVKTLANEYRRPSFRAKFDQLKKSDITFTFEKHDFGGIKNDPNATGGHTITLGQFEPNTRYATDGSVDRKASSGAIQLDLDQQKKGTSADTIGEAAREEVFHGTQYDNDPARVQTYRDTGQGYPEIEPEAGQFSEAPATGKDKPDMNQDQAQQAIKNAFGIKDEDKPKPDKKNPQ